MVTNARSRFWPVLLLLTAIMLVHPPSARADRIDIDDPSILGPVVVRDVIYDFSPYDRFVAEVRYLGGIYSPPVSKQSKREVQTETARTAYCRGTDCVREIP